MVVSFFVASLSELNLTLNVASTIPCGELLIKDCVRRRDVSQIIAALKTCINARDLERGMKIHSESVQSGDNSNIYVANTLMAMYARCGSLRDARSIFDRMYSQDLVSWNVLVLGYAENGEAEEALSLFKHMQAEGFKPNSRSIVAALKACTCLARAEDGTEIDGRLVKLKAFEKGMGVHSQAVNLCCGANGFVANMLVDFYANCGSMVDARRIFEGIQSPTVVSWTALVIGYAENGLGDLALDIFSCMLHERVELDALSFVAALKACSCVAGNEKKTRHGDGTSGKMVSLEKVMKIHSEASRRKCDSDLYLASSLVDTYVQCGSMVDARRVFDKMRKRNVVVWNSLIFGYAENGEVDMALELFEEMYRDVCRPDARTFVAALKACAALAELRDKEKYHEGKLNARTELLDLEKGMAIHAQVESEGFINSNVYIASTLIDMYVKYGRLDEARRVFEELKGPRNNVVPWNALILGYVDNGKAELALELLSLMKLEQGACSPDARTLVAASKACALLAEVEARESCHNPVKMKALEKGMAIHHLARELKLDSEAFVSSSLVDMYAKCGSMEDAWKVFMKTSNRDMVLWTALLLGYVDNGEDQLPLKLVRLIQCDDIVGSSSTVAGLNLCACVGSIEESQAVDGKVVKAVCLEKGMEFHSRALRAGCCDLEVARALVNMYAKCGSTADAQRVLDRMGFPRDVVACNSMILGYAENEQAKLGLLLFREMEPRALDAHSFVAALKACGTLSSLDTGKAFHALACRVGLEYSTLVGNSLIDLYGRCGSMLDSHCVFDWIGSKDVVSWTALMEGYSRAANSGLVLELFSQMQEEGLRPDSITLVSVLSACSHSGRLQTGKELFRNMVSKYAILPSVDHFVCLVDLLGRANELDAAVEVVSSMAAAGKTRNSSVLWRIVLDACRRWRNVEVGRSAFQQLLSLDDCDSSAYVLMASTF